MLRRRFKIRKVLVPQLAVVIVMIMLCPCFGQGGTAPSSLGSGVQHSILQTPNGRPAVTSPELTEESPSENEGPFDAETKINHLVTRLVLDAIPHTYSSDKNWGAQEKRWNGIKLRRDDGGRLETKRKWKMVNHGTWKKYSASLIDPEETFEIQIRNIRASEDEAIGFDLHFSSNVEFHARQAKWAKGVQLYNLSAEGQGKLDLVVACQVKIELDLSVFPPNFVFKPQANAAQIAVREFRINRVSKLGGEFAQQVTRSVRKVLDEKIAEKEEDLVEKINSELEEHADDMVLSLGEVKKQEWLEDASEFLPAPIRSALDRPKKDRSEK